MDAANDVGQFPEDGAGPSASAWRPQSQEPVTLCEMAPIGAPWDATVKMSRPSASLVPVARGEVGKLTDQFFKCRR